MLEVSEHLELVTPEDGAWAMATRPLAPVLEPYVREMTAYVEYVGDLAPQRQLPNSIVPMILVLGPGFDLAEIRGSVERQALGSSFVAGLHAQPVSTLSLGYCVCMQVNFTLIGARHFFRIDMHELSNEVVDLPSLLGKEARKLEHQLMGMNSWSDRFDHLERVIGSRLVDAGRKSVPDTGLITQALAAIDDPNQPQSVAEIAQTLNISRKHLATLFQRNVGVSTKQYLQLRRFERALMLISSDPGLSIADIAYASGYADQAHLSRQFRNFVGQTPSTYQATLREDNSQREQA